MKRSPIWACTVLAVLPVLSSANVRMPSVFSDNMVLQRELPAPIWGTAAPGAKVVVSFAGQSVEAVADDAGKWMAKLAPLAVSKVGRDLVVKGPNTLTFGNVVVGEVWLASGQSNMAGRFNPAKGHRMDPALRERAREGVRFTTGAWNLLTEKTDSQVSKVAFYFALKLYEELDMPIGLIQRYNSATPIQAWMPKEAADAIAKEVRIPWHWNDYAEGRLPSWQYKTKIVSAIPYAFRGVIWYQGERNAKTETGYEYDRVLAHHIAAWRKAWAEEAGQELRKFPFYYVQVPTQESPVEAEWPWLRDRMRRALELTENTGMAVIYETGPSLHPANKEPAGVRLALCALAKDYGQGDLVYSGPLLREVRYAEGKATLRFDHVGGGLRNTTGQPTLKFFEIAGKDGKYAPAEARIVGDTVVVHNTSIPEPAYVRYLFRKPAPDAELSLINAEGLPASSFMTDDFLPERLGDYVPPAKDKLKPHRNEEERRLFYGN